jgi:MAE_28990/MAE_18760-like HEPN
MISAVLENLIEDELRWRESELSLLKIQLLRDVRSNDHFPVSYRSFVAVTYAHYEGFVKIVLAQAVSDIFQGGTLPSSCVEEVQAYHFAHKARKHVSQLSNSQLIRTLMQSMNLIDEIPKPTGEEFLEMSNLNVKTFLDITGSINLSIASFQDFRRSIGRLVDLRHRCAHGEKLTFDSSKSNGELAQEVFDLQSSVILLMHATAIGLLDLFDSRSFLSQP